MTKRSPFSYFKTSPEIIRLAVMIYVRFLLSLRNVEDLLHERGINIGTRAFGFGGTVSARCLPLKCAETGSADCADTPTGGGIWTRFFLKTNGEMHYLWWAVDCEGEVLESYVPKRRDRRAAFEFPRKSKKSSGQPQYIVTDKLRSYGAALKVIGDDTRQETVRWLNNRAENSHLPFRRRERVMQRFRQMRCLQKSVAVHSSVHNQFNQEHHLYSHDNSKLNRTADLSEWRDL